MKQFSSRIALLLATTIWIIGSCTATPQIPLEKQQYIEGTMLEGGAFGFLLKDDSGNKLRFSAYHDAVYDPVDFHVLAGDRLGVTYGESGTKTIALQVALISSGKKRKGLARPAIGIIREAGMTRHKIHLPETKVTVIMLKGKTVTIVPSDWKPETGDKIRVQFSETEGRFMRKTFYDALDLLEKGPFEINDFETSGAVVNQDRDSFTVRLKNGRMKQFYFGSETKIYPEDDSLDSGNSVQIIYYNKLMGDRTVRPTAIVVNKIQ